MDHNNNNDNKYSITHVSVISITPDIVISCASITVTKILLYVYWYTDNLLY